MKIVKYLLVLILGMALGFFSRNVLNKDDNGRALLNDNTTDLLVIENAKKKKKIDNLTTPIVSTNQELLSQVEVLRVENKKIKDKLDGLQGLLGTLDKNTLNNLIEMATLENRYLSESNIDDDLEVVENIKSYIQDKSLYERNLLDDFLAEKSPSLPFNKVKKKLSNHIGENKDVDWAYQAEAFLRKHFISNLNDFSIQSIVCLTDSCQIIGTMQNYNTSKHETDIAIMEHELALSGRLEPIFISLIKDPNYFELLTDRVYGPYFSVLENYDQQAIPFVLYIDRSARSQIPLQ